MTTRELNLLAIGGITIGGLILLGRRIYGTEDKAEKFCKKLLSKTDIQINGSQPWDITIHNHSIFQRIIQDGSLGLGESYMDGWWDADALDQFFHKNFEAQLDKQLGKSWSDIIDGFLIHIFNYQTKERSKIVGEKHYDISNDFFKSMLDKRMIYTCGYWKTASNLDEAQESKLDLICKKLKLKPGMTILDIGSGWGGLAFFAAEKYGVHVTGVTISKEQYQYSENNKGELPVTFLLQDYRDCNIQYDRVVSVGMFEAVGNKNYTEFMEVVNRCLKDDGLCLLHTIGSQNDGSTDRWIEKYIFPNGKIPSLRQIVESSQKLFVVEDLHNFGADYDKTLMAWYNNFQANWSNFEKDFGERFYRMWKYYLLSCAAVFRSRQLQLWQFVFSKKGIPGGYDSIR